MGWKGARRWPFVAREGEVALLTGDGALSSVIVGEPGVGKTRLLAELVERLSGDGRRIVSIGATRSLASVPFGAFAGVLASDFTPGAPFEALSRALDALAAGRPEELVLAVDDAHLLDDASAGLVLLAARSGARVLVTTREREPSPDAITRLWKDDLADRIELQPLDQSALGVLLHAALGGTLDSRSLYRLFDVTRGNLLFVRELVRHALATGSLVERGGVWSWTASAGGGSSVYELVRDRLANASAEVTTLAELLAVGEPLGPAVVARLCEPRALAEAEHEGLVAWHPAGRRRELRLVHPLYAEVVRDSMGPARRAARSSAVADAVAVTGANRRDDRLRVTALRLEAGSPCDPAELRAAASEAGARADLALADRLARAAVEADASAASMILLANVLYWEGRHDELVALLGGGLPAGATPTDDAAADLLVASSLFWGLDRFDEANEVIERGIERAGSALAPELLGQRSQMLMFAGRALESIEVGRAVLDDPASDPVARLRAYSGVLPSAAVCGRLDAVAAELPAAMDLALGISGDLAMYSTGGVMIAAFISQLFAGGLAEIDLVVGALHAQAVERVDDPFRGVWSFVLGRSALAQGRVAEALLRLRDSTALLRDLDPGGMLPWSLASLAYALGVAGDANAATATMTEVDAARRKDMHNIDIDIELARAWAANARGERTQARAFAEKIGRALLDDGRTILGAYGLHDAMRLGVDASSLVDDLSAAAAVCDGVVADTFAAHARALVAKDLDALLAASSTFEGAGWVLQAAECAAAAGMVASEMGLKRRERDASAIAATLARRCAPAVTPMLETIAADASVRSLTKREHEVALMAARGMSKREIANALFLSVRTVGNHINHIYGKLGVRSRAELHEFFAPDR